MSVVPEGDRDTVAVVRCVALCRSSLNKRLAENVEGDTRPGRARGCMMEVKTPVRRYTIDEVAGMRTLVSFLGDDVPGPLKFGQSYQLTLDDAQAASDGGNEPMCFRCGWGWFCHSSWECLAEDHIGCGYVRWGLRRDE